MMLQETPPLPVNGFCVGLPDCSGTPHTPKCRLRKYVLTHAEQELLDFNPRPQPVQQLGPTPEDLRKAQKPATVKVLQMLKAGPCSTGDFIRAGVGRFGARILELRAVGYSISMRKVHEHGAEYRLEGERSA